MDIKIGLCIHALCGMYMSVNMITLVISLISQKKITYKIVKMQLKPPKFTINFKQFTVVSVIPNFLL